MPRNHDLPRAFLTLPEEGERTSSALEKKVRLIALKELLTLSAAGLGPRAEASWSKVQSVVRRCLKEQSSGVLSAVGSPDVLPGLLSMASSQRPPSVVLPGLVPALLASLHGAGFTPDEAILWEHPYSGFAHPRAGWVDVSGGARSMLLDAAGLAVESSNGSRTDVGASWVGPDLSASRAPTAVGRESLGVHFSLVDSNPLSMDEAHPDKSGNEVTLGEKTHDEWVSSLNQAMDLIGQALPEWYAELVTTTHRLVPVGYEPEMHLSASYREAPGLVYLTLHPDPLTMAEAIIHETQHGKLNRLSWLDPVLNNAYTAWSESPVRPDLRPVMGVLLAVHAFVPVAALHERLESAGHPLAKTHRFQERRAEVLAGNAGGLDIVERMGDATPLGQRVIDDLRRLHDHLVRGADTSRWAASALPPG